MDLGKPFWRATGWVYMVTAEITSEIEGFLDWQVRQILVTENDNFPLRNQQGQLIFACRGELAELHSSHF